jgi:hypothetical protein
MYEDNFDSTLSEVKKVGDPIKLFVNYWLMYQRLVFFFKKILLLENLVSASSSVPKLYIQVSRSLVQTLV